MHPRVGRGGARSADIAMKPIKITLEFNGLRHLQKAFVKSGAVRCGFCTPGMILGGKALLERNHQPDEGEIPKRSLVAFVVALAVLKSLRL